MQERLDDHNRKKNEAKLWFPVLTRIGYTDLETSPDNYDKQYVIDATGIDSQGNQKHFALRSRSEDTYKPHKVASYNKEFTIRYARPSGIAVEWKKLFDSDLPLLPDYFAYGWRTRGTSVLGNYIILDIPTLQVLYQQKHLDKYLSRKLRNVDYRQSEFIPIPIRDLIRLPSATNLIAYHSDNHPALM